MRDRLRAIAADPTGVETGVLAEVVHHHRIGPSLDHLLKHADDADATSSQTSRHTKCRPAFRVSAPGSSPASHST